MPNQARDAQGDTATACGINPIKLFRELDSALDDKPILVADGGDFVATSATPCVRGIGKTAFRKGSVSMGRGKRESAPRPAQQRQEICRLGLSAGGIADRERLQYGCIGSAGSASTIGGSVGHNGRNRSRGLGAASSATFCTRKLATKPTGIVVTMEARLAVNGIKTAMR